MAEVRNDSDISTDAAMALLEGKGILIEYGHLAVKVLKSDYERARQQVLELPLNRRQEVLFSIDRALVKNIRKINKGKASKVEFDQTYADLMLWKALKEISAS